MKLKSFKFFRCLSHLISISAALWPYIWGSDLNLRTKLIASFLVNFLSIIISTFSPLFFAYIIDNFPRNGVENHTFLLLCIGGYVALWAISKVFICLREILILPVVERGISDLTMRVFNHVLFLPSQYHHGKKIGEFSDIIQNAVNALPNIVLSTVFILIPLAVEVCGAICIMAYVCGLSYVLVLGLCFTVFIFVTQRGLLKVLPLLKIALNSHVKVHGKLIDSLLNCLSIKIFNAYNFEQDKIRRFCDIREKKICLALQLNNIVRIFQILIVAITFFCLMFLGIQDMKNNLLTLGGFIMIHTYILQFVSPLEAFSHSIQLLNQNIVNVDKALKILVSPLKVDAGHIVLNPDNPLSIVFENVWFGYKRSKPLLKGASFNISPADHVAIVGESGAGKSTIIGLILGFLVPWKGRILINGYDIKDIKKESLISLIGIVPQDISLFHDTIMNNILYSNPRVSEENLLNAIQQSGVNKIIRNHPDGHQRAVGERGTQLSGGERQRIGIARALIRKPKLFIFDEPTSSLDPVTERSVLKNIESISKEITTVVISHKLSTIQSANRIIHLQDGNIGDRKI